MEKYSIVISCIALLVSVIGLKLSFKNRETTVRSYKINRHNSRASLINLEYLCSKQFDDRYHIKLVLFNPSPIATIIKSFSIYKEIEPRNWLFDHFISEKWKEIDHAVWWPTESESWDEIKTIDQEYKNLLVKDHKDIIVSVPGNIDNARYRFLIKTNQGGYWQIAHISEVASNFPHSSEQWYREK